MPDPMQPKEISPEMMQKIKQAFPMTGGFAIPLDKEYSTMEKRLDIIEEKIDKLSAKLELIFGKSILMKGRFIEL